MTTIRIRQNRTIFVRTIDILAILKEVERRITGYYMAVKMTEAQYLELEGALVDAIWFSNEKISKDDQVKLGVQLINRLLEEDAKRA
ncbi:hypothetical protein [Lacticaseibacillus paracasei]|uniref:hypothetical protein n=1 Tax=Lacticaseibacillus paracasei TaxID=1597 RepID=UPI003CF58BED